MTERMLRRKLSFHAHGRTLVLVKRPIEKLEHRVMMALLWALYVPRYPHIRVDVPIGQRYQPDLVQLDGADEIEFWAEAGAVGDEKLRYLCSRQRSTHLVFAKWATNLAPVASTIEQSLRNVRRTAPIELIGFDATAERFIDETGNITISFHDLSRRVW